MSHSSCSTIVLAGRGRRSDTLRSRPRRPLVPLAALLAAAGAAAWPSPALADGGSRVVVVAPSPNGTPVPVAEDETVAGVSVVTVPGGGAVAVVRVVKQPKKADVTIVTPDGISHTYTNGDTGVDGVTVTHEPQIVQDENGRTHYRVVSCYQKGGRQVGCAKADFPPGSQLQHDPPQPAGTTFLAPDAVPADAGTEAAVLSDLGVADDAASQVWSVPSGELRFSHATTTEPETVTILFEPDSSLEQTEPLAGLACPVAIVPLFLSAWFAARVVKRTPARA